MPLTAVQLSEKKEEFREKLMMEARKLKLSEKDIQALFIKGKREGIGNPIGVMSSKCLVLFL